MVIGDGAGTKNGGADVIPGLLGQHRDQDRQDPTAVHRHGQDKGLTTNAEIVAWLKEDYELGAGHAQAMARVIRQGPEFELKHTTGTHRDASGTLKLDGKDT